MTERKSSIWFWVLLLLFLTQNMADMVLLRIYTGPDHHETFPILAYFLRGWGLDGSIWAVRALVYTFVYLLLILKRLVPRALPWINDFLVFLNLVYFAGMTDELFFTGILKPVGSILRLTGVFA